VTQALATPKVVAYASLVAISLLAAVVLGQVVIIALGAPFAFALAIGLFAPVAALPEVSLGTDTSRLVEGGEATISLELRPPERIRRCELCLVVPAGLGTGSPTEWALAISPHSPLSIDVPVTAERFGRFVIGPVRLRVPGAFGLLARSGEAGGQVPLEVRPRAEVARTLVRALETRATAGDRLARQRGDGIEFAEVRPYTPGSPGRINWRVTARRAQPYVNLRHPERSTDLIILVDTFSADALARQVRAAAGLATAYLARHDRVGLVAFGGILQWVEPAMGQVQLERIIAALTATRWHHSYAWKSAEAIPARTLPATGLVLAISSLEDQRMLHAVAAIRARGVDLAIVETRPAPEARPLSLSGELARRILELERAETRDAFARRGVPVVAWQDGEPLEAALLALASWRRRARGRMVSR
jgi:uncharacterized protein (DUF58 family)